MHKYGAAAQQAYTLVTTPLAATASQNTTPPPPAQPLSLVLQLVGHGQLDDISGVSMYSTAHSVYLKCQPLVLQDMPECTLALCRPACVLAPTAQQQPVDSMPDDECVWEDLTARVVTERVSTARVVTARVVTARVSTARVSTAQRYVLVLSLDALAQPCPTQAHTPPRPRAALLLPAPPRHRARMAEPHGTGPRAHVLGPPRPRME